MRKKNVEGATHLSCVQLKCFMRNHFNIIVIDEAQMIADRDRGFSWYKAITKANAKEVCAYCMALLSAARRAALRILP
ncbi:hypothetical protein KHA80_00135 [Anaerobacillus sp. HL2]|nr:hypothetical protein KHA80_00135 [Anaerobacillus sp. HL2]